VSRSTHGFSRRMDFPQSDCVGEAAAGRRPAVRRGSVSRSSLAAAYASGLPQDPAAREAAAGRRPALLSEPRWQNAAPGIHRTLGGSKTRDKITN